MATVEVTEPLSTPEVKRTMLVALRNGKLMRVDFSESPHLDDPNLVDWDLSVSKIFVGKFQMQRTRALTLEEIEIEKITHTGEVPTGAAGDTELTVYHTIDGRNPEPRVLPPVSIDEGGLVKYSCRVTGQNFSIGLRGTFNLNTIILTTHNNGRR